MYVRITVWVTTKFQVQYMYCGSTLKKNKEHGFYSKFTQNLILTTKITHKTSNYKLFEKQKFKPQLCMHTVCMHGKINETTTHTYTQCTHM